MEPLQNQQKDLARVLVLGHASDKSSMVIDTL